MTTYRLRKVGILSVAMIGCITGAGMGLIIMGFYLLFFLVAGAFGGAAGAFKDMGGLGGSEILAGGIGLVILFFIIPVLYAIMGFIGGALYGFVYNLASKMTGGLSLELEDVTMGQH